MRNIFSFQPFNLYNNTAYHPNWAEIPGKEIMPGEKCERNIDACVQLEKVDNIVGLQCSVWSETIMTDEILENAIFPRIFACAERAYNPRPDFVSIYDSKFDSDFENFVQRLPKYIQDLEKSGIYYNIPPPGAKCTGSTGDWGDCELNTLIPGMPISHGPPHVRSYFTTTYDGKRSSRVVYERVLKIMNHDS